VSVCNWLHSVGQNYFYIILHFNQGYCYIQSLHFGYVLQEDSVQNSRQCSSDPLHQSGRQELSVQTPICIQKIQTIPCCIRLDVSATCLDSFQCSTSKRISFPNTNMGRQLQPSGRPSYFVRTLSLIRQVVQKMFNRPNVSLHCPDARSLLGKLHAAKVQPFRRGSIQERILANLESRLHSYLFGCP